MSKSTEELIEQQIEIIAYLLKDKNPSIDEIKSALYYQRAEGMRETYAYLIDDIRRFQITGNDPQAEMYFADFIFEVTNFLENTLKEIDKVRNEVIDD